MPLIGMLRAGALLAALIALPAKADPAVEGVKDALLHGCIPYAVLGTPLPTIAQAREWPMISPQVTDHLLRGKSGSGFLVDHGTTIIAARSDGRFCTIVVRRVDTQALTAGLVEWLVGDDRPFRQIDNRALDFAPGARLIQYETTEFGGLNVAVSYAPDVTDLGHQAIVTVMGAQ